VKIGIIGCGLIGGKRAQSCATDEIAIVYDQDSSRAYRLAQAYKGCVVALTAEEVWARKDVTAVVIATTHDALASLARAALEAGKHVLVEKPGAINAHEMESVIAVAQIRHRVVKVGFNHRFHPAFIKARQIVDSGLLGEMMFLRGRYGHGGRLGYESEWRANPSISGGGELIDQGMHLIDLSLWFLGDFPFVEGHLSTYFWDMPVEDNAFMLLRSTTGKVAWLHASWTEWKNCFCFEIAGRFGKLQIDGLGGSYGVEQLAYYQMKPEMGPPETTIWQYPGADSSWAAEWLDFQNAITSGSLPCGGAGDALAALRIVEKLADGRR
jgi:predicted dehydrogenase